MSECKYICDHCDEVYDNRPIRCECGCMAFDAQEVPDLPTMEHSACAD